MSLSSPVVSTCGLDQVGHASPVGNAGSVENGNLGVITEVTDVASTGNKAKKVQYFMESLVQKPKTSCWSVMPEEEKEELVFNPVTGELEVLQSYIAHNQFVKPVMTSIAKNGFFALTSFCLVSIVGQHEVDRLDQSR